MLTRMTVMMTVTLSDKTATKNECCTAWFRNEHYQVLPCWKRIRVLNTNQHIFELVRYVQGLLLFVSTDNISEWPFSK